MARTLALPLMLVALLVGGYLLTQQSKTNGPAAAAVARAENEATAAAGATNLQAMTSVLEAWHAANDTYSGAALPAGSGVVLARADATSYCLQTTGSTAVSHEAGPNGTAQPGAC